jgi:hypothetical protein
MFVCCLNVCCQSVMFVIDTSLHHPGSKCLFIVSVFWQSVLFANVLQNHFCFTIYAYDSSELYLVISQTHYWDQQLMNFNPQCENIVQRKSKIMIHGVHRGKGIHVLYADICFKTFARLLWRMIRTAHILF